MRHGSQKHNTDFAEQCLTNIASYFGVRKNGWKIEILFF